MPRGSKKSVNFAEVNIEEETDKAVLKSYALSLDSVDAEIERIAKRAKELKELKSKSSEIEKRIFARLAEIA